MTCTKCNHPSKSVLAGPGALPAGLPQTTSEHSAGPSPTLTTFSVCQFSLPHVLHVNLLSVDLATIHLCPLRYHSQVLASKDAQFDETLSLHFTG